MFVVMIVFSPDEGAADKSRIRTMWTSTTIHEIVFPADISRDEFESHVVEHFSYEESETLRNFDTVPDAFWPGIEHDPEM